MSSSLNELQSRATALGSGVAPISYFKEFLMISFKVDDMTCGHCASTITSAVKAVDPKAELDIDISAHLVQIQPGSATAQQLQDVIADAMLQQVLTRPGNYDVIATMNLNGDYISDALAAQVGGIGIAPGGNINYDTGVAVFEATHGTAPKYAGMDKVNPGSLILSGEMMFRYMGWNEAADLIVSSLEAAIGDKIVTYDFARLMEGATEVKTSEFADAMIERM